MDDLVEISRLRETTVSSEATTHRIYDRQNRWRSETWVKSRELGRGSYGAVWLEKEASSQNVRAVKQVRKHDTYWDYKKEIAAMARVRLFPQHFAFLHGWYESEDWIFLAMDVFELGDLSQHLDNRIPENQAKAIAQQLCCALVEMHRMGFAHRDLKPQNVFVFARTSTTWDVRIGDFGITKRVQQNETVFRTMTGTQAYMAPEMFPWLVDDQEEHAYTQAVDMWALGIMLYQMLTLELPFGDRNPLSNYCKNRSGFPETLLLSVGVTLSCISFIKSLLQPLPSNRPTSEAATSHIWLRDVAAESPLVHEHEHETLQDEPRVDPVGTLRPNNAENLRPMISRIDWVEPEPGYTYAGADEHDKDSFDTSSGKFETPMTPITANITSVMAMRLPSYPRDETFQRDRDTSQHEQAGSSSDCHFATVDFGSAPKAENTATVQSSIGLDYNDPPRHKSDIPGELQRWDSQEASPNNPDFAAHNKGTVLQPVASHPATSPKNEVFWNDLEDAKGKLPPGWQRRYNDAGKVYYVDHNTKQNTWIRPMPIPVSENSYFDGPHRGSDALANSVPSPATSPMSRSEVQSPPLPPRRKPVGLKPTPSLEDNGGDETAERRESAVGNADSVALDTGSKQVPASPSLTKLRVTVIKAKGLKPRKSFSPTNSFAEIYVNDKVLRTNVVKNTLDPRWNESFEVQVQKQSTIRIAVFDELRTKENDRGFLGLVAFDVKDRIDLDGNEDKIFDCRLTNLHKQAWYSTNDVAGRLKVGLSTKTESEAAQIADRFAKLRFEGLGVANLWKQ